MYLRVVGIRGEMEIREQETQNSSELINKARSIERNGLVD